MNEYQVAVGETTFGGREELMDPKAIVDYGSLMNLALQRGRTAREALQVMTSLVEEYGYARAASHFHLRSQRGLDPGDHFQGTRPQGRRLGGANGPRRLCLRPRQPAAHPRIPLQKANNFFDRKQTTFHAADVVSFAREKGYFKGKDAEFSFADAYAPADFGARRFCEGRVWQFFRRVTPDSKQMDAYQDWALGIKADAKPMPLFIKPDKSFQRATSWS